MALNQFTSPEGDLDNYLITEYWLIDQYIGDTLLTWGVNGSGQLGDNTISTRLSPITTFAGGTNWKSVVAGYNHSVAIKTDGTLWTWGSNSQGQLGDNTTPNRSTPVTTFSGGTNWKQVASGYRYTAAIKTDGTLWSWGIGSNGNLGNNTEVVVNRTPVTTFAGGSDWKQVSCGQYHTVAIKTDGTLWTWGLGTSGQLGNNVAGNISTPVTTFAGGTNWKQVSCGYRFTVAIKTDGSLWGWGINTAGQLGLNNVLTQRITPVTTFAGGTNWKQVAGGNNFTAAIKTDGTLWTWGSNSFATLGDNTTTGRSTPVTTFAGGTNWKQVACANIHTAAIKTDGTLWIWGSNVNGQLGDGSGFNRSTPVTTFAGGTNWKQVLCNSFASHTAAVTSGTDPTYFIS